MGLIYLSGMTYHVILLEFVRKCNPEQMGETMALNLKIDESALLRLQLEKLEGEGIKLYLDGAPSTTDYIVNSCINEDTVYMPDYVTDESGKVKEIRYDRISSR